MEFNIAPHTQLGRVIIPNKVYEDENHYNNPKYERAGEYIENLTCDNIIEFCHRWMGLANFNEILEDMAEYYNKFNQSQYMLFYRNDEGRVIEQPVKELRNKDHVIKPVIELEEGQRSISPIIVMSKLPSKGVEYNGYYAGLD